MRLGADGGRAAGRVRRRPLGQRPGGTTVPDAVPDSGVPGDDNETPGIDDDPGLDDDASPHPDGNDDEEDDNNPPPHHDPPAAGLGHIAIRARFPRSGNRRLGQPDYGTVKVWFPGTLLAAAVLSAGCGAAAPPASSPVPAAPPASTIVVTVEQAPAATTVTLPPTSTVIPTPAWPKATTKAPARKPPQYGYQCRDGDEVKYEVCAGHKAWVDGQREFTDCLAGGGTWDVGTQRCVRP